MLELSIEELRHYLSYDAETGVITWKRDKHHMKAGDVAGGKDGQGYWRIGLMGIDLMGHRVAFALHYLRWPEKHIDHINHDKSDNRISNLRECSAMENMRNLRPRKNTISGYTGVRKASANSWQAVIRIDGKPTHIGQYKTAIEAAKARDDAVRKYYGEFAVTNFPMQEKSE